MRWSYILMIIIENRWERALFDNLVRMRHLKIILLEICQLFISTQRYMDDVNLGG
jgi:hypothetical protein